MVSKKFIIGTAALFILTVGILLLVVGQDKITGKHIGEAYQKEEPLKIGVLVYPGSSPFFVAKEKGFFEKEGANAEVEVINDPSQMIAALAGNRIQLLYSTADFTPVIADAGVDVKEILAVDIGYGSDGLLAKKDISSVNELKNRTVYLSFGTPSHFFFRYATKEAGLKAGDVKLIHMEAEQVGSAFVAGKIDYGMSWEPWLSKASERADGRVLFSSKDKPGIITDTLIVRSEVLQFRRDDVKAVMRALLDAVEFQTANPTEANSIAAKNMGISVNELEAQLATVRFLNYTENLKKFDKSNRLNIFDLTESAIEIYKEDGIIKSEIAPGKIVDVSLLDGLYG